MRLCYAKFGSYGLLCATLACRLYKVHDEDGKPFELEMSWICDESGRIHQKVSKRGGRNGTGVLVRGLQRRKGTFDSGARVRSL